MTHSKDVLAPKIKALRDLAEGGFEYADAIAMVGIPDTEGAKIAWRYFLRNYPDETVSAVCAVS